jgi:Na+/melibiose symporter-like transporter
MDPEEQLRRENQRKHAALPWWRRLPWLLMLAVPLALLMWAIQLAPGWRLLAPLIAQLAH